MAAKTPVKATFTGSDVTGLAEFQTADFISIADGGTGLAAVGSAGQVLKVNSGGTALEYGNVEAIVNIDGATDLTSATLATSDLLLASDGGTEGRITLGQIDTLFTSTTQTLTNKSIDSDNNTITNIVNADIKSSAAIAFSKMEDLTASRALASDSNGDVSVTSVTSTELGYISGVTSAIQTQIDNKADKAFAIAQAVALG